MISPKALKYLEEIDPRIIGSPFSAYHWQENVARQQGRTTEMIKHLPSDGRCVIVVHKRAMRDMIRDMIQKHRPDVDFMKIKFVSVQTFEDAERKLTDATLGWSDMPIFFDNAFFYMANESFITKMNMLYGQQRKNKELV